jgi:hypothetical protein
MWISGAFDHRPKIINNSPTPNGAPCQQFSSRFKKLIYQSKTRLSPESGAA